MCTHAANAQHCPYILAHQWWLQLPLPPQIRDTGGLPLLLPMAAAATAGEPALGAEVIAVLSGVEDTLLLSGHGGPQPVQRIPHPFIHVAVL